MEDNAEKRLHIEVPCSGHMLFTKRKKNTPDDMNNICSMDFAPGTKTSLDRELIQRVMLFLVEKFALKAAAEELTRLLI